MYSFASLLSVATLATARTLTYDWELDWVTAAPDGVPRAVIGINGQWPCPLMEVDEGDVVVMNIKNNLGNQTTGIHCHGEFQIGSAQMDGVPGVSMCPLETGSEWTQSFTAHPSGTHWYHSHAEGQYPDGIRAPMIVHDRAWEASLGVEEQYILPVSDWYHTQAPYLANSVLTSNGRMPTPDASLMNDSSTASFNMQPGKQYLFRMVSMSSYMAHTISFEDHSMLIVAVDGEQIHPYSINAITLNAGQRYDAIIKAKDDSTKNYAIFSQLERSQLSNTGTLKYTDNDSSGTPVKDRALPNVASTINDLNLVPLDDQPLLEPVDQTITYVVHFQKINGQNRIVMGNNTYLPQQVPSLYTALTTGESANNPAIYGATTNPSVIQKDQIIQLVVNNYDGFAHPMHLHGHRVQVVARGYGQWNGDDSYFPLKPLKRDTVATQPGGHLVLRFKADNPGVWPFHCHMEWHVAAGMRSTIIEAPLELQKLIPSISDDQLAICKAQNLPTSGNCAGATVNLQDTSGCNNVPDNADAWGSLTDPPASGSSSDGDDSQSGQGQQGQHGGQGQRGSQNHHGRSLRGRR